LDRNAITVFSGYFYVSSNPFGSRTMLTICRYVAMHAMQEDSSHDHSSSNGYAESAGGSQRRQQKPQMRDTLAAVGGMLIPLLTQVGHHH
jgi:hypothetical protein